MAPSRYDLLECRAVLKPDRTELYVLIAPATDATSEPAGWYTTTLDKKEPWIPALLVALQTEAFWGWKRSDAPDGALLKEAFRAGASTGSAGGRKDGANLDRSFSDWLAKRLPFSRRPANSPLTASPACHLCGARPASYAAYLPAPFAGGIVFLCDACMAKGAPVA